MAEVAQPADDAKNASATDEQKGTDDANAADAEEVDTYKVGKKVAASELLDKDKNDKSLNKMKQQLIGDLKDAIIDANDKRQVFFDKLIVKAQGRVPQEIIPSKCKKGVTAFVLKEGCSYSIEIVFRVQREIVIGLKKIDTFKKGLSKKEKAMMGSFAPSKNKVNRYVVRDLFAPSGFLYRGKYAATTLFTDDDNTEHLKFEYQFEVVKEWPKTVGPDVAKIGADDDAKNQNNNADATADAPAQ